MNIEKLYANTEQAQVSNAVKQVSDIRSAAPSPDFDCSGFTQYVYAHFVVSLGTYIHAPHTGDVIKISPMSRNDYITARRVN